ncbi:hypothetical protein [Plantactinospora soyae]|uniref:Uncharacterized protein n=1 Tax=Plantactinospora soyae TaxID=1544732 RepID=A0A927MHG0_9ACTN|nr:hypothetical protein [Plantactinospora soyae]MBE1491768.1 hypothetical protein [Plantactinospora soyae]
MIRDVLGFDRPHPLDRQQYPHMGEHVAGQGYFDVDAEAGAYTCGEGFVDGGDRGVEPDLWIGCRSQ